MKPNSVFFSSLTNNNDEHENDDNEDDPIVGLAAWDDLFLESSSSSSSLSSSTAASMNTPHDKDDTSIVDVSSIPVHLHPSMMFDPNEKNSNSNDNFLDDDGFDTIDQDYNYNNNDDDGSNSLDEYDTIPPLPAPPPTPPTKTTVQMKKKNDSHTNNTFSSKSDTPPSMLENENIKGNEPRIQQTTTDNPSPRVIPPILDYGMDDIDMDYNPYDDNDNHDQLVFHDSDSQHEKNDDDNDFTMIPQLDAWDIDNHVDTSTDYSTRTASSHSSTKSTTTTTAASSMPASLSNEKETNDKKDESSSSQPTSPPLPPPSATTATTKPVRATLHTPSRLVDGGDSNDNDNNNNQNTNFYDKASSGNGATSHVDALKYQLIQIEQDIYKENNGIKFNINSSKQLSIVLFGPDGVGQSTNKLALEAIGGGNTNHSKSKLADLVLMYRTTKSAIKREEKRITHQSNGNHVTNVHQVHRRTTTTTATQSSTSTTSSSSTTTSISIHEDMNGNGDPLLLVDASAYIFRAYYSMPTLHRSDGTPVGAVLGFCNMLNRLVLHRLWNGERPRLVLVFDAKGPTFRHDLYDLYKANRKECPMDLIPQFDLIRTVAQAYGIQQLEATGFEADDVIATLATMAIQEGVDVNILSGDKDLMQLITPENAVPSVHMIDPKEMARTTYDGVVEKWGVPPELVGDLLALTGDASDNIPGIKGIGPKGAAELLNKYGSLDNVLENANDIPQKGKRTNVLNGIDDAKLSRQLVELERFIPKESMTFPQDVETVSELRMEEMNSDRLLALYQEMGFKKLTNDFQHRLTQMKRTAANNGNANTATRNSSDNNTKSTAQPTQNNNNKKKNNNGRSFSSSFNRPKAQVPKPEDFDGVPF